MNTGGSVTRDFQEMTFLDHLEELRQRLFRIIFGLVITTIIGFVISDYVIDFMLIPATRMDPPLSLQVLEVPGMFMIKLEVSILTGVVLAIPVIVYQLWGFIEPGLYPHEKKYFTHVMIAITSLFLIGIAFAYFLVVPFAIRFLTGLGPAFIQFNISITAYFSFVIRLCLLFGFIFELPFIFFILSVIGLVGSAFLVRYRRHAIVIIFLVAGILTPPDIFTQVMMAVPLILLYEVSIIIVKAVEKKRKAKDAEAKHYDSV